MVEAKLAALVDRLEKAVARAEGLGGAGASDGGSAVPGGQAQVVKDFLEAIAPKVQAVKAASDALAIAQVTKAT